ncbi:putative dnaJ molecular chaperone homology domain [Lyophyllum shimeji]|uniref:DnaJ molecular chaperone homology domain n=1 Tax=Lyophyllum shimeji TaxID=47721 RepID=A0A9P3PRJ1_LYOSH|nr:putative dnaJ molecular chaperone homology domain [Lyophyllum shimeji]
MVTTKSIAGPSSFSSLRSLALSSRQNLKAPNKSSFRGTHRPFSTSRVHCNHYQTLGVPQSATKAQIKSHFYRLSKKHHPDVSKDPQSKDIFSRVSEAYSVLSNDRERRLYDRSLLSRSDTSHAAHPQHTRTHYAGGGPVPEYSYRSRPGATHAWEHARRHPHPSSYASSSYAGRTSEWWRHQQQARPGRGRHYEPPPPPRYHEVGATKAGRTRAEREREDLDRVQRVSGLKRALQLVVLILVSAGVVGGWR